MLSKFVALLLLLLLLHSFWAADLQGKMSYRTEGKIFHPSVRTSKRTNIRPVPPRASQCLASGIFLNQLFLP